MRKYRFRLLVYVCTIAATTAWTAGRAPALAAGKSWSVPKCSKVSGTNAVTFTRDDGATLAPTPGVLRGTGYTFGLVALQPAGTLDAVYNRTFFRSTSAGCRWQALGDIPSASDASPVILAASAGDRAYGFSDGRPDLVRLDGEAVTVLTAPLSSIVGLAGDPADANRARLGGGDGSVWETLDGGATWTLLGTAPVGRDAIVYRVAFDPSDLDHALVGIAGGGAFVTFDGGATWSPSAGLASVDKGAVNVFNAVIAKADGGVVWAMGLDLTEADSGAPSGGRHIYRSSDGGLTFAPVVDQSPDVVLPNGPTMAAPPDTADVLYFTFGTRTNNYGTDVYRYDVATGTVTKTHNPYHRMPAIEFNPADPSVIYLGLAVETGF